MRGLDSLEVYNMKNVPCKNCTDRKVGCHADCEAYKKCKKEHNEARKQLANESITESALWNVKRMR